MTDTIPSLPGWLLELLIGLLVAPARLLLEPTSRSYWPYLAVSLAAAAWLRRQERRRGARLPPRLDVFSSTTWLGRSAMNDYWLVIVNTTMIGGLLAAIVQEGPRLAAAVAAGLHALLPSPALGTGPALAVALAATLFVVDDLVRYLLHRVEHAVPALWALHKVHHSAEALNFVTAERHHPLSLLVYAVGIGSAAALVNGACLWACAEPVAPSTLLGANAFWLLGNLLGSSLRHSPAWLSFGPRVERWLLSPAQHQLHHSEDPRHFGCNLGGTLAVWDRLFGTLLVTTHERVPLTFGLGPETASYRSLPALYLEPLRRIAHRPTGGDLRSS
ncbi:MAG: hypothetical protein RJA99_4831 [Pseudomonadota bacterium]|jgi:sterol desaturase/sphingolipid hydroxylase (fatty acid hydroxylase superfamily)